MKEAFRQRLLRSGKRNELVAKAAGLLSRKRNKKMPHPATPPTIIDTCAGHGFDGMILAKCGANVCMIERDYATYKRLRDMVRAMRDTPDDYPQLFRDVARRIRVVHGDAKDVLRKRDPLVAFLDRVDRSNSNINSSSSSSTSSSICPDEAPLVVDTIYLDPMHDFDGSEERRTGRSGSKRQKLWHDLRNEVGNDEDAPELLRIALGRSDVRRVVLKSPSSRASRTVMYERLAGDGLPSPTLSYRNRSVRFDVWIVPNLPQHDGGGV